MHETEAISFDDILEILPHRPPFLFVDRVIKLAPDRSIVAERTLREDEPHFKGHFPRKPIMPGVLVTDALAQTSGLLIGLSSKMRGDAAAGSGRIFFLAAVDMKYTAPAYPGETLLMTARAGRTFGALRTFTVDAVTKRKNIARGTLTLALVAGEA